MLNWTHTCIILAPATERCRQPGGHTRSTGCITPTGPPPEGDPRMLNFFIDNKISHQQKYAYREKLCKKTRGLKIWVAIVRARLF